MSDRDILVTRYKQREDNVLMFVGCQFLILPVSEIRVEDEYIVVNEENLTAAWDVTPELPCRVLNAAWKHGIVFASDMDVKWAVSVGQVLPGFSGHDIVRAFQKVTGG